MPIQLLIPIPIRIPLRSESTKGNNSYVRYATSLYNCPSLKRPPPSNHLFLFLSKKNNQRGILAFFSMPLSPSKVKSRGTKAIHFIGTTIPRSNPVPTALICGILVQEWKNGLLQSAGKKCSAPGEPRPAMSPRPSLAISRLLQSHAESVEERDGR